MRSALALLAMFAMFAMFAIAACGGGDDVSRLIGARCERNDDCDDRCIGPSNDFPDGLCTLDCRDIGDCPDDSDCIDLEGGVCLFTCGDDDDCRFLGPRWICREENLREDGNVQVRVCRGD